MHEEHGRAAVPRDFHKGNIQAAWATARHYHGSRIDIHIGLIEGDYEETRNRKKAEHGLPPTNRRPNRTDEFHLGAIPPRLRQLLAGRLERAPAYDRIRLQQWISRKHQAHTFLRKLRNEPRISGHRAPDLRKNDITRTYESIA